MRPGFFSSYLPLDFIDNLNYHSLQVFEFFWLGYTIDEDPSLTKLGLHVLLYRESITLALKQAPAKHHLKKS